MNEARITGVPSGTESLPRQVGRSTEVETSEVGDRVVLYHVGSGKSLVLNPTGTWLWRQMEAPLSVEALVTRLQAQYPTLDTGTVRRDVEAYLRTLAENDVLQPG